MVYIFVTEKKSGSWYRRSSGGAFIAGPPGGIIVQVYPAPPTADSWPTPRT